jgi:TonB family protein
MLVLGIAVACTIASGAVAADVSLPPADPAVDRTARRLAGLEPRGAAGTGTGSGLFDDHARVMQRHWDAYERRIGQRLREWARTELEPAAGATVFYPFSGPDLLTVQRLYPDAARYVLVALQRAEPPPPIERASPAELTAFLRRFDRAWGHFGSVGFYRTNDLDEEQRQSGLRAGASAPLMTFAALLGHEVRTVTPIRVNADGTGIEPHPGSRSDAATWNSVRLTLVHDGRTVLVDYVRADLSDAGLANAPNVRDWITRMAGERTVLKAASHLLQKPNFAILRDALLERAPSIVQDETGIDYALLAAAFRITLYGNFRQPHELFNKDAQRSLAQAYAAQKAGVRPLSFRTSYQRLPDANLQVAVRAGGTDTGAQTGTRQERQLRALELTISRELESYEKRRRQVFLTRNAADADQARYVEAVRARATDVLASRAAVGRGSALVSLTLLPDGALVDLKIERGSGEPGLDRRIKAALSGADGFPAWPRSMAGKSDTVVVTLHLPGG